MKRLALSLTFFLALGIGAGVFVHRTWWQPLALTYRPLFEELAEGRAPLSSVVYDIHGVNIGEFSDQRRLWARLDELPTHVVEAFLSAEDRDFWNHPGVSPKGVMRAFFANLKKGEVVQGGSTITQQLVRSLYLTQEQTLQRKLREATLALMLEQRFDKKTILEMYLNYVFLGNNSYGVEAASRNYFRKPAASLNPAEGALLAGLPQAPSRYAPHRNLPLAKKRQRVVLERMVTDGVLTKEEAERWAEAPLDVAKTSEKVDAKLGYFLETVRAHLKTRLAVTDPETAGLRITTAIDRTTQGLAADALSPLATEGLQGALIVLDGASGEIRALQGGTSFDESQFNRVLHARRPAGAMVLPLVASLALEKGLTFASPLMEARGRVAGLTLWQALMESRLLESASLATTLGVGTLAEHGKALGFEDAVDLSWLVGGAKATPLEMAMAYGPFAAKGQRVQPRLIERVTDRFGNVLYEASQETSPTVVSPQTAYMLRYGLAATDTFANMPSYFALADDGRDGWLVVLSGSNVALLWVGGEFGKRRVAPTAAEAKALLSQTMARMRLEKGREPSPPPGIHFHRVPTAGEKTARTLPFRQGSFPTDRATL